jgi:hypothetical protein
LNCFVSIEIWTQGLIFLMHVFFQLSHSANPKILNSGHNARKHSKVAFFINTKIPCILLLHCSHVSHCKANALKSVDNWGPRTPSSHQVGPSSRVFIVLCVKGVGSRALCIGTYCTTTLTAQPSPTINLNIHLNTYVVPILFINANIILLFFPWNT